MAATLEFRRALTDKRFCPVKAGLTLIQNGVITYLSGIASLQALPSYQLTIIPT
jgi:hypothetical protein